MRFVPRSSIMLVDKNEGTELSQDIYTVSGDDDKNLITCTVIVGTDKYNKGDIIVTGKYSLYKLVYKGTNHYIMEEEDVMGTIED